MLRRHTAQVLLLLILPLASLGLVTWLGWEPNSAGRTITAILTSLAGASGVVAMVFAFDAARIRRAFSHLRSGGGALGGEPPERQRLRELRQHETVVQLRRQVEQLSAIRDLGLITNDDVELNSILERALLVLGGVLDAEEITLFLLEGPGKKPVAVAHRKGERVRVRSEDKPLSVVPQEAARALEARRTIVEEGRKVLRAATLLVAEGEVMGALQVRLAKGPLTPEARELAQELENLAKHIALAIRKPTLYDRAVVDSLTRLYTKRHFHEEIQHHMAQRSRLGTPLSLIILDLDHFKRVNDDHGHVAGDLVLAEVAKRVRGEIRAYDQAFRYGGEEMVVLAPNTRLPDAVNLAERLRDRLRTEAVDAGETELEITASFGVAEFDPDGMPDLAAFVEAADRHLYRAKHLGRDRVASALSLEADDEVLAAATPQAGDDPPLPLTAALFAEVVARVALAEVPSTIR